MDKSLKEFEAWAIAEGLVYTYTNEVGDTFTSGGEGRSIALAAWQASRKQALQDAYDAMFDIKGDKVTRFDAQTAIRKLEGAAP